MKLPEVGVGLTWTFGLESVVEANAGLIDVLEVEPHSLWRRNTVDSSNAAAVEVDQSSLAALQQRSVAKLVHSVNFPVGGTIAPSCAELEPLGVLVHDLGAVWISEHLAFCRTEDESGRWNTGTLLPPRQTRAGVETAAHSIRAFARCMSSPVAVEAGANYLRPRPDDLPDGEFVAHVAEAADCGILLDLHNAWTNDRNGRQSIGDFIEQLPLERVWEVHLSGGHFHRGYWLDSHSGTIPLDLLELASRIVPRLPNLKALVFELAPSSLCRIGEAGVRMQLEALHRLWDRRNTASVSAAPLCAEAVPHTARYRPAPGSGARRGARDGRAFSRCHGRTHPATDFAPDHAGARRRIFRTTAGTILAGPHARCVSARGSGGVYRLPARMQPLRPVPEGNSGL